MKIEIEKLQKDGKAKEEYILLKVNEDLDIGNYAIVDKTFDKGGQVSNVHRHFFRFPSKSVKKGEFVSLRTSTGTPKEITLKDGTIVHRFYWGSDAPLWNDDEIERGELLHVTTVDIIKK